MLQQTAAAILVPRDMTAINAAAAAELVRSAGTRASVWRGRRSEQSNR